MFGIDIIIITIAVATYLGVLVLGKLFNIHTEDIEYIKIKLNEYQVAQWTTYITLLFFTNLVTAIVLTIFVKSLTELIYNILKEN